MFYFRKESVLLYSRSVNDVFYWSAKFRRGCWENLISKREDSCSRSEIFKEQISEGSLAISNKKIWNLPCQWVYTTNWETLQPTNKEQPLAFCLNCELPKGIGLGQRQSSELSRFGWPSKVILMSLSVQQKCTYMLPMTVAPELWLQGPPVGHDPFCGWSQT